MSATQPAPGLEQMELAPADQGALGGPWQGEATRAAIIRARAPAAVRCESQQTEAPEEAEAVIAAARAPVPCEGSLAAPLEQIAFQTGPVESVAVKAVLMTYEFDPRGNTYHQASCRGVSDLSSLLLTGIDTLRTNGHAKWQAAAVLGPAPHSWYGAATHACAHRRRLHATRPH